MCWPLADLDLYFILNKINSDSTFIRVKCMLQYFLSCAKPEGGTGGSGPPTPEK